MLIDPELIANLSADDKAKQSKALLWIQKLANDTRTDISAWDIPGIFKRTGSESNGTLQLYVDHKELTLRFFEYKKQSLTEIAKHTDEIAFTDAFHESINLAAAKIIQQLERQYHQQLDRVQSQYRDHIKPYMEKAAEVQRQLDAMTGISQDFTTAIEEVVSKGFFSYDSFTDGVLTFVTNRDAVLFYDNHRPRLSCNLGKFKISWNIAEGRYKIRGHENTTEVDGKIHPHIMADGNICWGRASQQVTALLAELRIAELLELTANMLFHYNHDDPYLKLEYFRAKQIQLNYQELVRSETKTIEDAKAAFQAEGLDAHFNENHYKPVEDFDFPFAPPEEDD